MNIVRALALILFFFSVIFFAFSPSEVIFNSPDENANAVYAWQFADQSMFAVPSAFDQDWNVLVHPRSTLVVFDRIVPVSFAGLSILAGLVASILGNWSVVLVTPMLALLAIIAWRQSIFKLFDNERLADLAALFLMIHPAFWHYTGRTMMHNVGFVSLLIIGFYLFTCRPFDKYWHKNWNLDEIFAGLSLGLALAFRSSEALWVLGIVSALFIWKRTQIGWKRVVVFGALVLLTLLPFLALNDAMYGEPWLTGYTAESQILPLPTLQVPQGALSLSNGQGELEGVAVSSIDEPLSGVLGVLFPFGIHEMNILRNVWDYGFVLYPWMTGLSMLGLIFVFKKKEYRPWLIVTLGLSIWLAFVYGSWSFSDNPDASVLTIANSYARYWLPLFVLASIFAAVAVDRVASVIEKRRLPYASSTAWVIALIVILFSARMVIWGTDGFIQTHQNLESFIEKKNVVLEHTPEDSIIVVDMADKYLFPERNVVTPLRDSYIYAYIPEMVDSTEVFYLGITLPKEDIAHLEDVEFEGDDVTVIEVVQLGDETLYQFTKN
jgi:hypothetical protein